MSNGLHEMKQVQVLAHILIDTWYRVDTPKHRYEAKDEMDKTYDHTLDAAWEVLIDIATWVAKECERREVQDE